MGCGSSKRRVCRTTSFQEKLHRPLPRFAVISILDDLLLSGNYDQFLSIIGKTRYLPAPQETQRFPSYLFDDEKVEAVKMANDITPTNLQEDNISKNEAKEGQNTNVIESTSEEDIHVINTWEIMDGLNDEDDSSSLNQSPSCSSLTGDCNERQGYGISCMDFNVLQDAQKGDECKTIPTKKRNISWDRNSKMYLYYGRGFESNLHKYEPSSSVQSNGEIHDVHMLHPLPVISSESLTDENYKVGDSNLSLSCIGRQRNADISKREHNVELSQYAKGNNIRRKHEFVKSLSELNTKRDVGIEEKHVNSGCEYRSASLKEWLYTGGGLYSPGIDTRSYGTLELKKECSGSTTKNTLKGGGSEEEISKPLILSPDYETPGEGRFRNSFESPVTHEASQADWTPFDSEFLAAFEKALEQLAEEEKLILREIEEHPISLFFK